MTLSEKLAELKRVWKWKGFLTMCKIKLYLLIHFLKWYCQGIDQWDLVRIQDRHGTDWFISIGLKPLTSVEENYRRLGNE